MVQNPKTENYDVIVVGAGLGGLSCALVLSLYKRRVLLLEKHNVPGGLSTSFVRGRFEFEVALHQMAGIGTDANAGSLRKFFERECGLSLDLVRVPEAYRVVSGKWGLDFSLPFGVPEFVEAVERNLPGSRGGLEAYLALCERLFQAFSFVGPAAEGKADWLLDKYPELGTYAHKSVAEVSKEFGFSEPLCEVIYGYWPYLGVPLEELDFTIWAAMLYSYIHHGGYINRQTSHSMCVKMQKRIEELGGEVIFNQTVTKMGLLDNGEFWVRAGESSYRSATLVANMAPELVRATWDDSQLASVSFTSEGARTRKRGASALVVYLGLSATPADLNLDRYEYVISFERGELADPLFESQIVVPRSLTAVCLNAAVPQCSPPGTTILTLMVLLNGAEGVLADPEGYFSEKTRWADELIRLMSKYLGVELADHIEEVEVATPQTFCRYTNAPQGTIYGYQQSVTDSPTVRFFSVRNQSQTPGLELAGGWGEFGHGFSSAIFSGRLAGLRTNRYLRGVP